MTQHTWTDERIKELRQRWEAGESATAIGMNMHLSRGSIIGKVNRLGLTQELRPAAALKQCILALGADRPAPSMPKVKWLERNYSIDNAYNLMNF